MKTLAKDIWFLLFDGKKKFGLFTALFLLQTTIEASSLVLIGSYIAILLDPSLLTDNRLFSSLPSALQKTPTTTLLVIAGYAVLLFFFLKGVLSILINRAIYRFSFLQVAELRGRLVNSYQNMAYKIYLERNSSDYVHALTGYTAQYGEVLVLSLKLFSEAIVTLGLLGVLFFVDPLILIILVFSISLAIYLYDRVFHKRLDNVASREIGHNKRMLSSVSETIYGFKEIRILGCENYFLNQVQHNSIASAKIRSFVRLTQTSSRYLIEILIVSGVVIFVSVAAYQGLSSIEVFPVIAIFGASALRLNPIAATVANGLSTYRFARPSITNLVADLSISNSEHGVITLKSKFQPKPRVREFSHIEIRDIHFKFPDADDSVLAGVNLDIHAGEAIGIVGESGSGKTTLVDLILGLLKPSSGSILYNNEPLEKCLWLWRRQIAYLPQKVFLIDGTISQNIALGIEAEDLDETRLNLATQRAQLTEFIKSAPFGLETQIGENGVRLSGGQQQRVALARALYHNRSILMLDESTSALDIETERAIMDEIGRLKGEKTLLIISHRLSMLDFCDRIVEIGNGRNQ
jgi:ATP-binding cassette, subfamily B, bacterial PglK